METIRIRALRHSAFYAPLLLTIRCGFLQAQGLEPVYDVATPSNTVDEGLLRGDIHLAQSAVAAGFAGLEQGRPSQLRHFAQINERDGFFLSRRGGASTGFHWEELAGQEVLVDHLFQPLAMLKYALHQEGLNFGQLTVRDAGGVEAMDAAFREGVGRYIHQQGPYAQQLEADGLATVVVAVGDVIGPVAFSSLCATPGWLETEMAGRFMQAYVQGREAARDWPAEEIAQHLIPMLPGIAEPVLIATIRRYQQLGCWSGSVRISESSYDKVLDIFEYAGTITQRHDYAQLVCAPPGDAV